MSKSDSFTKGAKKTRRSRSIWEDNLTMLERDILILLRGAKRPMTAKEIAAHLFGPSVKAEAKGEDSVRTVRNALRIPKSMGLLMPSGERGSYTITETFMEYSFYAAQKTAEAWRKERDVRRKEKKEDSYEA